MENKQQNLPHYLWLDFLGRFSSYNTQGETEHVVKT